MNIYDIEFTMQFIIFILVIHTLNSMNIHRCIANHILTAFDIGDANCHELIAK